VLMTSMTFWARPIEAVWTKLLTKKSAP
jgi:hypothetical protein